MKLAIAYTVFDTDLLKESIENIYELVDHIIICYQSTSNKGNVCNKVGSYVIDQFWDRRKVFAIEFTPDLAVNTKENERKKHNLMLETAKNIGCSHIVLSACDHFYDKNEFIFAKKSVETADFDVTFTKMYTYYRYPSWQLTPIEDYYMPFIIKLYPQTQINRISNYPVKVDPSVQVNTYKKYWVFPQHEIMMHHYSMIRVNIREKFKNAAASIRWKKEDAEIFATEYENYNVDANPGIKYFGGRKIKVVDNHFNIPHLTDKII